MTAVILGALGLVALLVLARSFTSVDPRALAQGVRAAIILVCVVAGVALVATGRFGFVFLPLAALAGVYAQARGRRQADSAGEVPRSRPGAMTRAEALKVLDLNEGASEEEILAAYRKLIMQNHPDRGGSTYLAAKINQAKDVLLGK